MTAFLIESKNNLLPDPAQESVQLLRQIAAQTAGKNWVAEVEPGIDRISICVNVFWFLSLVLSLTTALVGIVSLQWIRSHIHRMSDGADCLGLSYMHSLGLHQSYIPLIFTSLPIILIFGLTFFFIGLIVFLCNISWPVAIPVTFAIACTFAFLIITTALPALQSFPVGWPSGNPQFFPSPYRSPQSHLFIRCRDWKSRSELWLRHRTKDFFHGKKVLAHLESNPGITAPKPFAYDTIEALVSLKESQSAESDKERKALAKCLAEVLPIHLDLFPTPPGDLADLIPFLPPSEYVPSAVFLHEDSATKEDLSAVALLQTATCRGRPLPSADLVKACVRATRWLFERPHTLDSVPNKQPLHVISKAGTYHFRSQHCSFSSFLDKLSPDALEALIDTLSHFFSFAADFQPKSQIIGHTTHTSQYTYWFLVLSARILTERLLTEEMVARHSYILRLIASRLGERQEGDYLFYTASIYASTITTSPTIHSSSFWPDFIRAVKYYRDDFLKDDLDYPKSPLRQAVKADEVVWGNIDRAFEALRPPGAVFASDSHEANNTISNYRPPCLARDQDLTLCKGGETSGQTGDAGESPY